MTGIRNAQLVKRDFDFPIPNSISELDIGSQLVVLRRQVYFHNCIFPKLIFFNDFFQGLASLETLLVAVHNLELGEGRPPLPAFKYFLH